MAPWPELATRSSGAGPENAHKETEKAGQAPSPQNSHVYGGSKYYLKIEYYWKQVKRTTKLLPMTKKEPLSPARLVRCSGWEDSCVEWGAMVNGVLCPGLGTRSSTSLRPGGGVGHSQPTQASGPMGQGRTCRRLVVQRKLCRAQAEWADMRSGSGPQSSRR